jgi:hypothetical protein
MSEMKNQKPGRIDLNEVAADAAATISSPAPQPSDTATNSTNGKKLMYAPEEQARADRLKILMSATDKNTEEEGKERVRNGTWSVN